MQDNNWFMNPPHKAWLNSIVGFIQWHVAHGCDYSAIMVAIKDYGPKNGWDDETKTFVELATKIAMSSGK